MDARGGEAPRKALARAFKTLIAAAALAAYVAGALAFARGTTYVPLYKSAGGAHVSYARARVLEVESETIDSEAGLTTGYQDLRARLLEGEKAGAVVELRNYLNYTTNVRLKAGQAFVAHVDFADSERFLVSVYSPDRGPVLLALALVFAAALCGIGGRRGFRSLLGIGFTFVGIAFVFIPLLYRGASPAAAALAVTSITLCVSLALLGGLDAKTLSAMLGCLAGLAASALAIAAFQALAGLSGYTTAESDALLAIAGRGRLKVGELLFAAMLISSSGAVMDVAISIASAANEVAVCDPLMPRLRIFRSGMRVGRDMMGTMANTLILAFTGSSLNAIILIYSLERSSLQILDSSAIAAAILEALCGSLAVLITVPAVAFVSAILLGPRRAGEGEAIWPARSSINRKLTRD
jgi:uncharacterized membrane protein